MTDDVMYYGPPVRRCIVHPPGEGCECLGDGCVTVVVATTPIEVRWVEAGEAELPAWGYQP